jgi:stage II sporulation protein D
VKKAKALSGFSLLDNSSRCSEKGRKLFSGTMPIVRVLLICTLLFLVFIAGCKKRGISKATPQIEAGSDFQMRVLLLNNVGKITLRVDSGWTVVQNQPSGASADFTPAVSVVSVTVANRRFTVGKDNFSSPQLVIIPDSPYIFNLNGSDYRGKLLLAANPDGNSFDVINIVPLEPYLAGVVGAEMPSYWEPAALEAQAVCSRTYGLYIKRHFGGERNWDVTKTQANQVYLGVSAETESVWQAVNKTKGQVLVCRQADGKSDLFPTYFSSSCGGFTENSQAVFGGDDFESLRGVACPYCRFAAKENSFFWPDVVFDKKAVSEKLIQKYPSLEKLEGIMNIIPVKQSDYQIKMGQRIMTLSRLTFLKLTGSNGKTSFIKAEDLRMTIDPSGRIFKSTICKIADANDKWLITGGRGFGHGSGLCQCGSQAMARFESKNALQILTYYFPKSEIEYVY